MGKFTGTLNKTWFDGQNYVSFCKAAKIYDMTSWNPIRIKWHKQKYCRYSKNQPNHFIYEKKVYASARDWNKGRKVKNRAITLFPWRKV